MNKTQKILTVLSILLILSAGFITFANLHENFLPTQYGNGSYTYQHYRMTTYDENYIVLEVETPTWNRGIIDFTITVDFSPDLASDESFLIWICEYIQITDLTGMSDPYNPDFEVYKSALYFAGSHNPIDEIELHHEFPPQDPQDINTVRHIQIAIASDTQIPVSLSISAFVEVVPRESWADVLGLVSSSVLVLIGLTYMILQIVQHRKSKKQ